MDLANGLPVVAVWVADLPRDVLPILNETAKEVGGRNGGGRAEESLIAACFYACVCGCVNANAPRISRPHLTLHP